MEFGIDFEQEEDGRWITEIRRLPGVLSYGKTLDEARVKVEALAHEVLLEEFPS